jgi:hypothetical protein
MVVYKVGYPERVIHSIFVDTQVSSYTAPEISTHSGSGRPALYSPSDENLDAMPDFPRKTSVLVIASPR